MTKLTALLDDHSRDDEPKLALSAPSKRAPVERKVANVFKAVQRALRSSSSSTKTLNSTRRRGVGAGKVSSAGGAVNSASGRTADLQRVAVRWNYNQNKGDGQWAAHGRYIEREAAQEHELEQEPELQQPNHHQQKEPDRDGHDRYSAARTQSPAARSRALRFAYAATFGRRPAAKDFDSLRRLPGVGLVFGPRRGEVLLPGDAPGELVQRGPEGAGLLRRGSDGEPGAGTGRASRLDKSRSGAFGFGSDGDRMPISDTLRAWQQAGDQHLFKLIIAPEFGNRLDLQRHTTELVQRMERDLGTRLQWVAIDHHNTDDPHVHLAVRGVDDKGRVLEVAPSYIKEGSRVRAREAATRQLGYRTALDMAEALQRQVVQQRFTELDRKLLSKADLGGKVSFEGSIPKSEMLREQRLLQLRRLAQLETMGLARKTGAKTWALDPALESALRQRQMADDRLKTKFQHRELLSDPKAKLVATELKELGQRVAGRLVGTGLNEANNRPYLMVEGFDGRVHYVTQPYAAQRMRARRELPIGDFVELQTVSREDRQGNHRLAVNVQAFGRTMTPELIDRELLATGRKVEPQGDGQTVAGAYRTAAAERLQRLERAGAVALVDGIVQAASPLAHDRVRFADAGLDVETHLAGPVVGQVMAKGSASVAVQVADGRQVVVDGQTLEAAGLPMRFLAPGATVVLQSADQGRAVALAFKPEQLQALVQDRRLNKLDAVRRQLGAIPPGSPLAKAIAARAAMWRQRGVDAAAPGFELRANNWRKSVELHEAAGAKGLATVVQELATARQKPHRELACDPGRQVSGRVLLVTPEEGRSAIVIDAGKELMVLRHKVDAQAELQAGMRVRARAEQEREGQGGTAWRFTDLDREQGRKPGKARDEV